MLKYQSKYVVCQTIFGTNIVFEFKERFEKLTADEF